MFIISQYLLNNLSTTDLEYTSIYAIGIGLVVYACIYLYFLFYNEEFLSIFNKFIIYIIGIDLLLSSFYYARNKNSLEYNQVENSDNISDNISDETVSVDEVDIDDDIEVDIDDDIEVDIDENILDEHQFNIESDIESDLPLSENEELLLSVVDTVQENATPIPIVQIPIDEETTGPLDKVLKQETKKRRGRKPKVPNSVINF